MLRAALVLSITLAATLAAGPAWAEDDDYVMGNYEGQFTEDGWNGRALRAQVAATSAIRWRAVFYVDDARVQITGKKRKFEGAPGEKERPRDKIVDFKGTVNLDPELTGPYVITGVLEKETFKGEFSGKEKGGAFELKRVFHKPPTLGMALPEGATMLFDGSSLDNLVALTHWRIQADKSVQIQGSDLHTKQEIGSALIHLEFRCPFMPNDNGQARGNSGVYVQGRYEVQVLDSFADLPADNLCGGIYKEAKPVVCASLPPLQWQTYDITFTAPDFDASGNKTKNARITVVHNGITIHDDVELSDRTPGGLGGGEAPTGALLFLLMIQRPPSPTLCPNPTHFRSTTAKHA